MMNRKQLEAEGYDIGKIIQWIDISRVNSLQIANSDYHKQHSPKYAEKAKANADIAQRVIDLIRVNKLPESDFGEVWYRWYVQWAIIMIEWYNNHGIVSGEFARRVAAERKIRDAGIERTRPSFYDFGG